MNKLINIVLSGLLWRRYKFMIVSLIILIACIFIVGQIHDDYLAYAQTSGEAVSVGASFIVKWLIWIVGFALFIFANHLANRRKEKQAVNDTANKSLLGILGQKFAKVKTGGDEVSVKPKAKPKALETSDSKVDPFDALRSKDKLRSYADLLIDKHESHNKRENR